MRARRRRKRPAASALKGVRSGPLYMAEFVIGRGIGIPPGEKFGTGAVRCVAGSNVRKFARPGGGLIPYTAARKEFLRTRAEQVGGNVTGATLIPAQGAWMGGREPSFVGQVLWTGATTREKTPRAFARNMAKMCEALACGLSQKEVLLRLWGPGQGPLLHRCTPTGAPKP